METFERGEYKLFVLSLQSSFSVLKFHKQKHEKAKERNERFI